MADEDKATTSTTEAPEQVSEAAPETQASEAPVKKPTSRRKKAKRTVAAGHVHVLATFNNTIVTVTDTKGGVLTSASAGGAGFRGSKKGTAYAAQVAAEKAITASKQQYGLTKADVFVKGIGLGREAAVRVLIANNIAVESIKDVTGIPHGGARPKKARRV